MDAVDCDFLGTRTVEWDVSRGPLAMTLCRMLWPYQHPPLAAGAASPGEQGSGLQATCCTFFSKRSALWWPGRHPGWGNVELPIPTEVHGYTGSTLSLVALVHASARRQLRWRRRVLKGVSVAAAVLAAAAVVRVARGGARS